MAKEAAANLKQASLKKHAAKQIGEQNRPFMVVGRAVLRATASALNARAGRSADSVAANQAAKTSGIVAVWLVRVLAVTG